MDLKITYKNGMVRELDTNTYVASAPKFIRDEHGSPVAENETLATEFRLRWDLIQQIGLVAEIYIFDNNFSSQCQDQVIKAAYNTESILYLSPVRPAKVLRIIERNDLDNIIEIIQDGKTKIWRDIDGNLINFDNVNRVTDVNSNYAQIASAYEYLQNKWSNEDKSVIANLQKIEALLGIGKGRLSQILEEKSRLDREQRLKEAEQALEQLRLQNSLNNESDTAENARHNSQHTEKINGDIKNNNPVIDIRTGSAKHRNNAQVK